MSAMDKMMEFTLGEISEEDKKGIEKFLKDFQAEDMGRMMESCFNQMKTEEAGSFIENMPEMMKSCFPNMETGRVEEIYNRCRQMFAGMENDSSK